MHAIGIGDLTKDNMLAIEPRCHDGGYEELGTVAVEKRGLISTEVVKDRIVRTGCQRKVDRTYVLGPALAIESRPGRVCCLLKFSSANFSP